VFCPLPAKFLEQFVTRDKAHEVCTEGVAICYAACEESS
jgi:hypothetical protein